MGQTARQFLGFSKSLACSLRGPSRWFCLFRWYFYWCGGAGKTELLFVGLTVFLSNITWVLHQMFSIFESAGVIKEETKPTHLRQEYHCLHDLFWFSLNSHAQKRGRNPFCLNCLSQDQTFRAWNRRFKTWNCLTTHRVPALLHFPIIFSGAKYHLHATNHFSNQEKIESSKWKNLL